MNATLDHGLTPAALTGEAILRVVARDRAPTAPKNIALEAGRPVKNIGRELAQLVGAGLIDVENALTPEGREALGALDRAAGAGAELRVMPALLLPNPMNPRKVYDQAGLEGLADSAEAEGDFEQPLSVSPADMLGNRFIWAGHRRWRAAKILEGRPTGLPGKMAQGLRCIEREATPAQALFIAVVENDQRVNLSPLEDARALAALADAMGWSGRQVAMKTGRAVAGSEKGVAFVQRKLRVARNATPEAIAQYERDGSWDALVESCRSTEDEAAPDPQADFFPPEASELRPDEPMGLVCHIDPTLTQAEIDESYARVGAKLAELNAAKAPDAEDVPIELTDAERLVLIEIAHAAEAFGETIGETATRYVPAGKYWLDLSASSLQRQGLVGFKHHARPYIWITQRGLTWLRDQGVPIPIVQDTLDWARERAGLGSEVGAYATEWLNPTPVEDVAADAPAAAQGGPTVEDDAEADRVAAEALTDAHALANGTADPDVSEAMAWREILTRTGAPAPWTVTADFGVIFAADGSIACVVDQDNELRDDMAQARALVIAATINRACGLNQPKEV
ncbi:ParB N-terminal domain-containing protein [uncultured Brevundimonas sp.]|uniref:ParB/RepB/Spo0J family partition protein n=1 Tax=uncultured Brevundimonas sp. TaxID=213418 RepID=UPI0025F72CBB|nr:ParB N-terminal domain-containing protein [uncultured Brevundimonas sp.]